MYRYLEVLPNKVAQTNLTIFFPILTIYIKNEKHYTMGTHNIGGLMDTHLQKEMKSLKERLNFV